MILDSGLLFLGHLV